MSKKKKTEEQRKMENCLDLFESILKNNPIDKAKYFMLNLMIALFAGYKTPPFDLMAMYETVKSTGLKFTQPYIFLTKESKEILERLANSHDWSKLSPMFLSDFCEITLEYKQEPIKLEIKYEKEKEA